MQRVEVKLNSWRELYQELSAAEIRLEFARQHPAEASNIPDLVADVARLQTASEEALDAIHAQIATIKATDSEFAASELPRV